MAGLDRKQPRSVGVERRYISDNDRSPAARMAGQRGSAFIIRPIEIRAGVILRIWRSPRTRHRGMAAGAPLSPLSLGAGCHGAYGGRGAAGGRRSPAGGVMPIEHLHDGRRRYPPGASRI